MEINSVQTLWYLREGDFLPERVESFCQTWKREREFAIKFLAGSCNLVSSKEEAEEASLAIRSILIGRQALKELRGETRTSAVGY